VKKEAGDGGKGEGGDDEQKQKMEMIYYDQGVNLGSYI
jgi:hypothetical protein